MGATKKCRKAAERVTILNTIVERPKMSNTTLDLKAYFKRIGFTGKARPDLATLKSLQFLHISHIPFENLNPLLNIPVKIDIASLQDKMVKNSRGGYCFEQNGLFYHVLKTIGFHVTAFSGRVLWNKPDDEITVKSHKLLLVNLNDTTYLSDVGFGGQSLSAPLEFKLNDIQETPHEDYKIIRKNGCYFLKCFIKNEWKTMYKFTLNTPYMVDYKVANWYTSTHPDSHFKNKLIVARAGEDCRYVLDNTRFTVHLVKGESKERYLDSPEEIKEVLKNIFHLKPPQTKDLEPVLQKLCEETARNN